MEIYHFRFYVTLSVYFDENRHSRFCARRYTIYQITYPLRHVNWYLYTTEHHERTFIWVINYRNVEQSRFQFQFC